MIFSKRVLLIITALSLWAPAVHGQHYVGLGGQVVSYDITDNGCGGEQFYFQNGYAALRIEYGYSKKHFLILASSDFSQQWVSTFNSSCHWDPNSLGQSPFLKSPLESSKYALNFLCFSNSVLPALSFGKEDKFYVGVGGAMQYGFCTGGVKQTTTKYFHYDSTTSYNVLDYSVYSEEKGKSYGRNMLFTKYVYFQAGLILPFSNKFQCHFSFFSSLSFLYNIPKIRGINLTIFFKLKARRRQNEKAILKE